MSYIKLSKEEKSKKKMIKCVNLLSVENSRCAVLAGDYPASTLLNYRACSACCQKSTIDFSLHTDGGAGKSACW